jgi:glucose/arabinose dehydrogenase
MHFNHIRFSYVVRQSGKPYIDDFMSNYYLEKWILIIQWILLLAIAVQICTSLLQFTEAQSGSNSSNMHFTSYENPAYGIKFHYPTSWNLTENLTQVSVSLFPKNDSVNSEIEVAIKDASGNMTVDKYTDVVTHELQKKIGKFNSNTSQYSGPYKTMGNQSVKNMTFAGLYRGMPIKGVTVYSLNDNKAYVLTFISQKESYYNLFPEAQVLIDSLEVYKDLKNKNVTIERESVFDRGLIDFYTKFDNAYGGDASLEIRLTADKGKDALLWAMYHNKSIDLPNTYLIAQNSNDTWTTKQSSLNQTIGNGKWYHVRLLINDSNVTFYLNDTPTAMFKRPSNDTYSYLQLRTESASASFKNIREFASSGISQPLITPTDWYSVEETFKTKKIGGDSIFTLVPIYPPLGFQSVQPPVNDINLTVENFASGLNFPTGMAFLGPNDILVTEKNDGTVKRIVNGNLLAEPVLDVNVANKNERGMLGIAVDTKHSLSQSRKQDIKTISAGSTFVFLYYTESKSIDGDDTTDAKVPLGNRLYRYELVNNKLVNPKLLLDLPTTPSAIHNGGKIVIGPDHNIYLVVGNLDTTDSRAQNNITGKIPNGVGGVLRITQDGKVVENVLGENDYSTYYAYGIRNSFGIGFDPITGLLWDTENGPGYGDEINLVKPGFNSGWKQVQGIWKEENGTSGDVFHEIKKLVNFSGKGTYSAPEFVWKGTVGLTDIIFLNSSKLGKYYDNDMFVGDFHYGYLYHFELNKNRTQLLLKEPLRDKIANSYEELEKVVFGKGFGGITDLEVGPDGYLYILSVNFGGENCNPNIPVELCTPYSGKNMGSVFRIVPARSHP